LQTKEARQTEVNAISQYQNSHRYKQSWEQWINAGAPASQALQFLYHNGLFQDQYKDRQKELKFKAFQQSTSKTLDADNRPKTTTGSENPAKQHSHKRARSVSQACTTPWKHSNVSQSWQDHQWSSAEQPHQWRQQESHWSQAGRRAITNIKDQLHLTVL
jgi:hypothetical protein